MKKYLWIGVFLIAAAVNAAPYIGYVYPSGGERGNHVRLLLGGQQLGGLRAILFDKPGIEVEKIIVVPGFPNPSGSQRKYLIAWLQQILKGDKTRPELPEDVSDWRKSKWYDTMDELDDFQLQLLAKSLYVRRNPLQAAPSIQQLAIIDIAIRPDAEPGVYELRPWTQGAGVGAAKKFMVTANRNHQSDYYRIPGTAKEQATVIQNFPTSLNGQIMPGETDGFLLLLQKGEPYVFQLYGRYFQPFIGDAVPGHFQPVMRLIDPSGKEVAFADDCYYDIDPVLSFTPDESGEYRLEIFDNLYRGREDFVYHIAVKQGVYRHQIDENPFPDIPVIENAQVAETIPVVFFGVIGKAKETVRFRFKGHAGEKVNLDLAARSIRSPLDGVLRLFDPAGKLLAVSDDREPGCLYGEYPTLSDPLLRQELPMDGIFTVEVRDVSGKGNQDYRFYLKIAQDSPDFRVFTTTSSLNIPAGGVGTLRLKIERLNGFDGAVKIIGDESCDLSDAEIPAGSNETVIRLKNRNKPGTPPVVLKWYASGEINGKTVQKPLLIADETMQAFAYMHLLPGKELMLATLRRK